MMLFFPLQVRFEGQLFQNETNPVTYIIMGSALAALVLLIVVGNAISQRGKDNNSRRFSKRLFRKEGLRVGLSKSQIEMLLTLIRIYNVNRPFDLLKNSRTLNNTFSKALNDIDSMNASPDIIEKRKLDIYRTKQRLERLEVQTNRLESTRDLSLGQKITFQLSQTQRYPTVITANLKEFFCAKIPLNAGKEQIRWKKGFKIVMLLWGKDGEEQAFDTKVLGYQSVKGVTSCLLQHTNRIKRTYSRRHRRKKIKINCHLYPIRIVVSGQGRKVKKEAVVQAQQGRMVSMIDLSPGGCCLQTTRTLPRGELVKLKFEPHRGKPVVALGKIVDVKLVARSYYNLHIMFTRASSKNLNRINEYIYDFD